MSAVSVFNSGSISPGAQEFIASALQKEHFGENVHIFDGPRLEFLERSIAYSTDQEIRPRLLGLRAQIQLNLLIWASVKEDVESDSFREARGAILAGLEAFLSCPVLPEIIPLGEVAQIWQKARIIDAICSRYRLVSPRPDVREGDKASILKLIREASECCQRIVAAVDHALMTLKPLA